MLLQDTSMLVFLAIVAVTFLLQALAFLILALRLNTASRTIQTQLQTLLSGSERTLELIGEVMRQSRPLIAAGEQALESLRNLSEFVANYARRTGDKASELSVQAQAKVREVEQRVENALVQYQQASDQVHQAVLRPASEVSAVAKGVRTALRYLFRRGPRPVDSFD